MLRRIGHDFEIVVAVDLDRLVRSTKDLNTLIDLGAKLVTVDGEIDLSTADGEFRATMVAGIARFESRRASERQKRHKAAKALRGEWHGGNPPYGYRIEQDRLVPEPQEVDRIQEATQRLLTLRQPMHAVITDWNSRAVTTRAGKNWHQTTLRSILLNRSLLGISSASAPGWEPILDTDTFGRLTALLTDPSRRGSHSPSPEGGKYTLSGGLCVCGICRMSLTPSRKRTSNGIRVVIGCFARVHGPHPLHPRVRRTVTRNGEPVTVMQDTGRVSADHDQLEAYLFEQALAYISDATHQHTVSDDEVTSTQRVIDVHAHFDRLSGRRGRLAELYADGDITKAELTQRKRALDAEQDHVTAQLHALLGGSTLIQPLYSDSHPYEHWQTWTPGQRRAFLKSLIKRVTLNRWPQGVPRNPLGRTPQPPSAQALEDQTALQRRAMAARVTIEWHQPPSRRD